MFYVLRVAHLFYLLRLRMLYFYYWLVVYSPGASPLMIIVAPTLRRSCEHVNAWALLRRVAAWALLPPAELGDTYLYRPLSLLPRRHLGSYRL